MTPEKSLAANNRLSRVAIPAILLIILIVITYRLANNFISGTAITILVVTSLILIVLIIKGYKSQDIYYDGTNMYLKGNDGVSEVNLSKIKRIKMTLSNAKIMGLKFYRYKIEYLDTSDSLTEIHFWTTIIGSEIDDFEKEVKTINPYLKVEHWAAS